MYDSTRWHVCEDTAAARRILAAAATAIAAHGIFRIVLVGGRTPLRTYRLLSQATADWTGWHLYFSDERCLPPDHDERNSRAVALSWLERVPLPAPNIHLIPAELGAEAAAAAYRHPVSTALPFDLVTLGMGEDGHTASLFPNQVHPAAELTLPIHEAPKPPPDRVSLSARALSTAREIMILVTTGAEKRGPIAAWRAGEPLPVDVLIDRAANGA